jgi:hypothetical protein
VPDPVPGPSVTPAEEATREQARAVVERAVAAHGGAERLERLRLARVTYRFQGWVTDSVVKPGRVEWDVTVTETYDLPDRMKKQIKGRIDRDAGELLWVARPDGYWVWSPRVEPKFMEKTKDAEDLERPFQLLEDLAFHDEFIWTLTDDPAEQRPGKTAVRCRVEAEDRGRVFYFDTQTGLLGGIRSREYVRTFGREALAETWMADHKEAGGLQLPHKMVMRHDGEQTAEVTIREVTLLDEADDQLFAVPGR